MAEGLHSRLLYHVCMGGRGGERDTVPKGALSSLGPSIPALGHPGWEHSLTWAGPARRRAGCQAQNLPGVSDGRSASFQKPLIIQRNSRQSICSPPMHTPPRAPHARIHTARTHEHTQTLHAPRRTPCPPHVQPHVQEHTLCTQAPYGHSSHTHTYHTHIHHTYCAQTTCSHTCAYTHVHRNTHADPQTCMYAHTAVRVVPIPMRGDKWGS